MQNKTKGYCSLVLSGSNGGADIIPVSLRLAESRPSLPRQLMPLADGPAGISVDAAAHCKGRINGAGGARRLAPALARIAAATFLVPRNASTSATACITAGSARSLRPNRSLALCFAIGNRCSSARRERHATAAPLAHSAQTARLRGSPPISEPAAAASAAWRERAP
eukprot:scaffold80700_cov33-Tisochrysis_lutea.AAC.1